MDMTKQCQTEQPGHLAHNPPNRACQFRNVSINEGISHPCNTKYSDYRLHPAGNTALCSFNSIRTWNEKNNSRRTQHQISIIAGISKAVPLNIGHGRNRTEQHYQQRGGNKNYHQIRAWTYSSHRSAPHVLYQSSRLPSGASIRDLPTTLFTHLLWKESSHQQ